MRILSIPAMVFGIALAILFFKVYGIVTRPEVPRPVAFVIGQFAPGVEIGAKVADARHAVAGMTYVRHLGYVGMPAPHVANLPNGSTAAFAQVRLLLDERTRMQAKPDPAKARIEGVETVTNEGAAPAELTSAFSTMFRRPPRDGCIHTSDEGRLREVHVWTTPNERGGLALVTDFDPTRATAPPGTVGMRMTSVIAFTGKFDGGRTLRANYTDATCAQLSESQ